MKSSLVWNRKVQLGFGAAILTLLGSGVISYRALVVSNQSQGWVRHTGQVLEELQEVLSASQNIESSSRGFVLTGDKSYIESFKGNILREAKAAGSIEELTADNLVQQRRVLVLKKLLAQKIRFSVSVIDLRQAKGMEAAAELIGDGPRQQITGDIQDLVLEMQDEERRLLAVRDAVASRQLEHTKIVLVLASLLGLLTALAAEWSVRHENGKSGRTEETLRGSEEKYRMLVDGVRDYAIFMLDLRGQILSWNAGAEKVKGYKAEEIIGHNFSCFFPPEEIKQGRPEELLRLTAITGRQEEQRMRIRKDGSRFLANLTFTALRDRDGNLKGFSEFSHDLSESKESGAKYRGLLEAAPDAMVVVNQSGEIVLLNVQAEKQFGYRRDELVGQKVKNIIPEGFAERLIADGTRSAAEALAQQIGTGIELSGRRKNGSEFPIEIMLSPLESAEGILVTAAIRNISTRKDAEEHLAQMEGRYRGLLEAAPDAMVVVNQSGEIVLLNVQAEKQFGYRRDELVGQKVKNIIPEGFAERLIADGTRSAAEALAQQIGTGIELSGRRKDGSEFPIEIMLSPLESAEGILVTAAIRNISVRKDADLQLVQKVEELNRSNEELQQFSYVASHDLQEPLRMVASYTQLLANRYKGKLDVDADEFIDFAVDGCNRMQRLIQDLLAYSRSGTDGKALQKRSSEDALNNALKNLSGTIEESGAVVTHDALPAITTDDTQLEQVFQNLVGNAIKYRGTEVPTVHISAARKGLEEWTFSVRDNGLGIEAQYFERIFILFQRLHGRTEFKGTGIGLAICKKIVEGLGGRIWVESQVGKGSTFYFTLPGKDLKNDIDSNELHTHRSLVSRG
jgi:PAS domain S-box-containing protein